MHLEVLKPEARNLVQYLSEALEMLSLKELAVTKAYTIGRRGEFKDYVDLYFLLAEKHIELSELLKLARQKYKSDFNDRLFLEQLLYQDDLDSSSVTLLKQQNMDKKQILAFFEQELISYKID